MNRKTGFVVAFFALGLVTPILIVSLVLSKYVKHDVEKEVTVITREVEPSAVGVFNIDYDQYGNMNVCEPLLKCNIDNNASNTYSCDVYIRNDDTGSAITEKAHLNPAGSVGVFDTSWSTNEVGKYNMTLVYEVSTDAGISVVECPYTILVNK